MATDESERDPSSSDTCSNVNVPYFFLISLETLSIYIRSRKSYDKYVVKQARVP